MDHCRELKGLLISSYGRKYECIGNLNIGIGSIYVQIGKRFTQSRWREKRLFWFRILNVTTHPAPARLCWLSEPLLLTCSGVAAQWTIRRTVAAECRWRRVAAAWSEWEWIRVEKLFSQGYPLVVLPIPLSNPSHRNCNPYKMETSMRSSVLRPAGCLNLRSRNVASKMAQKSVVRSNALVVKAAAAAPAIEKPSEVRTLKHQSFALCLISLDLHVGITDTESLICFECEIGFACKSWLSMQSVEWSESGAMHDACKGCVLNLISWDYIWLGLFAVVRQGAWHSFNCRACHPEWDCHSWIGLLIKSAHLTHQLCHCFSLVPWNLTYSCLTREAHFQGATLNCRWSHL